MEPAENHYCNHSWLSMKNAPKWAKNSIQWLCLEYFVKIPCDECGEIPAKFVSCYDLYYKSDFFLESMEFVAFSA